MGIEHKKHVFRVFLVLGLVIVGALVGRIFLVPETFGRYGHYRAANVPEQMEREVRHGGDEACGECHDGEKATHDAGPHAAVRCESCHDALATHVRDGDKYAEMTRTRSVTKLCARCHRDLAARRDDFPTVNIEQHVADQGARLSDTVCFECHDPHDPTP